VLVELGKTLIAWLVLTFVSVNLLGFFLRGVAANSELEIASGDMHHIIKLEARRMIIANRAVNVIALSAIILFVYAMWHFWNIGIALCVMLMMGCRIPDLIWEMNNGKRLEMAEMHKPIMHKPIFSTLATLITWMTLPFLWYSINKM